VGCEVTVGADVVVGAFDAGVVVTVVGVVTAGGVGD
jgi:hypothetical protein